MDRESLKASIQILAAARRPLLIFPEGHITRTNDRLGPLLEGTAFIARSAARQRAEQTPPGAVVVHPVAIRYLFLGDLAKSVIIQFARGDKTVPNPTATALIRSGDLTDRATFYRNDIAFPLGLGLNNPHTFLTSLPKPIAIEPQIQIGVFFASDGALTIDPDSVGLLPPIVPPLFETPIAGALPEDLGFLP